MTSSNRRQRQLARAKFERQQARRVDREDTARVRQRLVAIVVVGALVIAGGGWAIFTLIDRGSEPESTASEIDEVAEELIEEIEAGGCRRRYLRRASTDTCRRPHLRCRARRRDSSQRHPDPGHQLRKYLHQPGR